jgi:hypothetical protein
VAYVVENLLCKYKDLNLKTSPTKKFYKNNFIVY